MGNQASLVVPSASNPAHLTETNDNSSNFCLSFNEAHKFEVDQKFDYYDARFGQFYRVTILEKKNTKLKIHYDGYNSQNDKWVDYFTEIRYFAAYNSITNNLLANHNYSKYFALEQWDGNIESIVQKMQSAMTYIKTNIVPMLRNRSDHYVVNLTKWVSFMYYYLFELFISTPLKKAVKDDKDYQQIVNIFNETYREITDDICIDTDVMHLQISREVLSNNDMKSHEKIEQLSEKDADEITKLKIMWHSIHDQEFKFESNQDIICTGAIDECMALKRINCLLNIFDEYFIHDHTAKKSLAFMDIFNILHDSYRTHHNLILLINDFEHIRQHHIEQLIAASKFKMCNVMDTCICNKRNDADFEYESNYFGFNDIEDVNVCKYMMKMHMFLSHKEGLQTADALLYNETLLNNVKMRDIITKRKDKDKDKSLSKFVTEIDEKSVIETHTFEFGEHFYYWQYFKDGMQAKGDYYIDKPDFSNLKDEMLSNTIYHISLSVWNLELNNATMCRSSKRGKQLKANNRSAENGIYEIAVHTPISICQVMVILFYTNHTKLQYRFKKYATRKLNRKDTLYDIKKRNKQIGNWYRLFYEVMELFSGLTDKACTYYHGLSIPLMFTSFNPKFNAPISTSVSIIVAARFADTGVILCLNVNFESFGCMDVSWLSNYAEEKERLFAYEHTMFINDIRFDHNHIGFNHSNTWYIRSIRLFDSIFCGNTFYSSKQKHQISQKLLSSFIDKYYDEAFTVIDEIRHYLEDNHVIKEYIEKEEYDSDGINHDIEIDDDTDASNICHQFDDTKHFQLFRFFVNKQQIPQYLHDLFAFKLEDIKKKKKSEKIFIIKSEYTKLNMRLKQQLIKIKDDTFCLSPFLSSIMDKKQIQFIDEFVWNIRGDEYTNFLEFERGKLLFGPHFSLMMKCDDGIQKNVEFRTQIIRSHSAWPQNATVGIRIIQLPLNVPSVTIGWNYAVLKPKYLSTDFVTKLKQGEQCGYESFNNESLTKMNNGIVIKFSVRIC